MKIVLCICTYRRPDGLKKLLNALPALHGEYELEVVVADNDAQAEGLTVCEQLPADYPFTVTTVLETTPGISSARNAATALALTRSPELVAFLDDDEWPERQWLAELIRIQTECAADVVGGPTRPVFPAHADPALLDNPYYGADMALPDGSQCLLQAGGNFLIKARVLEAMAPTFFHPAFAQSGGEDLAFFMQLDQLGHTMYWAAAATVHEPVPESRLEEGWMRSRITTIHNSRVRVLQLLQPGIVASTIRVAKTAALGTVALASCSLGYLSPRWRERARMLRWKFEGKLSAHLGRTSMRNETY